MHAGAAVLLLAIAGCNRNDAGAGNMNKTKFPGMVTADGGTSGEVLTRNAKPVTDAVYAGGTPGIAGGSGGNTGGAKTGGTVQESGQGPSAGTTQPASAGQAGTTLPPGDMGKPAGPAVEPAGAASHSDNPPPAAPGR
jgi:hypothetical protein